MLVVDVPECDLVEHALDIGKLEQHHRVGPIADRRTDRRHELGDVRNVLERVPADDDVRVDVRVALVVEIGDPFDVGRLWVVHPLGMDSGVDADAVAGAGAGHLDQELALATADLEDGAVLEVVVGHPPFGEFPGEAHEPRREPLGLLVALRVLRLAGGEGRVRDESASITEGDAEFAPREVARLGRVVEEQATVGGHARFFEEHGERHRPTCRTGCCRRAVRGRTAER